MRIEAAQSVSAELGTLPEIDRDIHGTKGKYRPKGSIQND
jgi:hypothetical protein